MPGRDSGIGVVDGEKRVRRQGGQDAPAAVHGSERILFRQGVGQPGFLEGRLRDRAKDDEAVIRRRLTMAMEELRHYREYGYILVNDRLDECVRDLKGVVRAARVRINRADLVAQSILSVFEQQQSEREG